MKTDPYQTKRRNIISRKIMKRKVEEKQIEELLELFLSLPNDTQHYWGDMVQSWKRNRTTARERERSERNERKEGVTTCWKIF